MNPKKTFRRDRKLNREDLKTWSKNVKWKKK